MLLIYAYKLQSIGLFFSQFDVHSVNGKRNSAHPAKFKRIFRSRE